MELVERNTDKLIELCVIHRVGKLYLFGSALTNQFNESSDIDLLVQFNQIDLLEYFDNYMDFKEQLEALFGRSVDLVENQAIKNPIFRRIIDREKQLIYERKSA
jgi:predicted nucleotidyltransferase